jgi:3,4-dihydroxy 2-butanone 4-phosphate synthase/GTP cyclohydrolase II
MHRNSMSSPFTDVETAVAEIRAGRMIVVVDDEDRENEGDLTIAAEFATPEAINFMAKYGRGLVCLALTEERLDYLRLGMMTAQNTSQFGTAFTESIDAREGVTTGISAYDRARTIQVAIDPASRPSDLVRPGHTFPLRARKGGVLVRAGQTEAAVDLARMAGLIPAGVICEIMKEDGTMARVPDLIGFCAEHNLKMLTVAELIRYRMQHERYVKRVGESLLPTPYGEFRLIAYESEVGGGESHSFAGDVLGATLCDCRAVLEQSMRMIAEAGRGAIAYLHRTGREFSTSGDRKAELLLGHDRRDSKDPERQRTGQRQIGLGAQILSDLNLRRIRLLTNHPRRVPALEGFGIEIVEQVPVPVGAQRAQSASLYPKASF